MKNSKSRFVDGWGPAVHPCKQKHPRLVCADFKIFFATWTQNSSLWMALSIPHSSVQFSCFPTKTTPPAEQRTWLYCPAIKDEPKNTAFRRKPPKPRTQSHCSPVISSCILEPVTGEKQAIKEGKVVHGEEIFQTNSSPDRPGGPTVGGKGPKSSKAVVGPMSPMVTLEDFCGCFKASWWNL